jgi:PAS domain S-box-containing protein
MLNLDRHFFPVFDRVEPATAFSGTYNLGLVATSVAIAILAAFVALSISDRIVAARTPQARYAWASAGAISMGGGIWSMHFVGMLAFSLPCGITYDPLGTVLSMIPGMLASGIALAAISKPAEPGFSRLLVSAVLMGGGIGAMHYSGMAAMQPQALLRYDPGLVAISLVVAVVLAFISLSIRFPIHRPQASRLAPTIIAASVMGCAVAGMHYTAMEASIFFPLPDAPTYSMAFSPTLLALLVTIFAVLIAVTTLVATFAGQQSELAFSLSAEVARRRRIEDDLRRSEMYLAEAQRLSHVGSFGWDVSSGKLFWSEETFRIFEYDLLDQPTTELALERAHPDDKARVQATIDRAAREKKDLDFEHRLLMPDGKIKNIHLVGHPVVDPSREFVEFVGTVIDVTERRRAEEERQALAHANRITTMGQLTASIAHEVNQPITAVVTSAQAALRWLNMQPPDPQEVRQALGRIVNAGRRAGDVIGRIRALIAKTPTQKENLDVNNLIIEVIGLTRSELHGSGVSLRTQLSPDLPLVQGDRVQLQQVMLNLILNAVEALSRISEGPRELLISSVDGGASGVHVAVRDSGPGMPPERLRRLFDAFYTTKPGGMGMGLSICRSIVEAHGGRISAAPNEPRGAAFEFTLPREEANVK